jgi:hypothetical protein
MFVETYFDERAAFSSSSSEPMIPYPELVGEEFMLWQRYLPVRTELRSMPFWLLDNMPRLVLEELEKAQKAPRVFERIEIWSRSGDPMAVGVTGGEQTRYFSIARWGDAKLTLDQVKRRLRIEKWMFRLTPLAMILMFLIVTLVLITHAGQFSELAQKASYQGELFGY